MGAAHSPFLFWDGRKDSLWSQALGPMEDPAEHGGNRVRFVKLMQARYKEQYQAVFGPMPSFGKLPDDASPGGNDAERAAWVALPESQPGGPGTGCSRTWARPHPPVAFVRNVSYGESRFDRYAQATVTSDGTGQQALSQQETGLQAK